MTGEKPRSGPGWLTRACVEERNHRTNAWMRTASVSTPLTARRPRAEELSRRQAAARSVEPPCPRRAERLYARRRWSDARAAFVRCKRGVRRQAALRCASRNGLYGQPARAREALAACSRPQRPGAYFNRGTKRWTGGSSSSWRASSRGASRNALGGQHARAATTVKIRPGYERNGLRQPCARIKGAAHRSAGVEVAGRAYGRNLKETVDVSSRGRQLPARRQPPWVALLGRPGARAAGRSRDRQRPLPPGRR